MQVVVVVACNTSAQLLSLFRGGEDELCHIAPPHEHALASQDAKRSAELLVKRDTTLASSLFIACRGIEEASQAQFADVRLGHGAPE